MMGKGEVGHKDGSLLLSHRITRSTAKMTSFCKKGTAAWLLGLLSHYCRTFLAEMKLQQYKASIKLPFLLP